MESIIKYLQATAGIFILEIIWLIPGVLLAFGMNRAVANLETGASKLIGNRAFMLLFGWLGTLIHESGHLLFCLIFRHKIGKVKLFTLNPEDHVRGYVNHSYDPRSFYQRLGNFFIGIGPVLLSALIVYLLLLILLDFNPAAVINQEELGRMLRGGEISGICKMSGSALLDLLDHVFRIENLADWRFYLFIYLGIAAGSAARLSSADFRHAWVGMIFLGIILLAANFALLWTGSFAAALLGFGFLVLMVFYLIQIFVLICIVPPGLLLNRLRSR